MPIELREDNFYESEDGAVSVSVDFADPSEREASVWYKAESDDEKQKVFDAKEDFIRAVFALYDVDLEDGNIHDTIECEGGLQDLLDFPPEDSDEQIYNDGEEIDPDDQY